MTASRTFGGPHSTRVISRKMEAEYKEFGIEVKSMGQLERWSKSRDAYKWVDGYSVFLDGNETQPWLPFREAMDLADVFLRLKKSMFINKQE